MAATLNWNAYNMYGTLTYSTNTFTQDIHQFPEYPQPMSRGEYEVRRLNKRLQDEIEYLSKQMKGNQMASGASERELKRRDEQEKLSKLISHYYKLR